ncbi:hypothetical protein [Croceivirga thetidis]|uniref:Lipoprotein n=1 Tax=Croceivirga thetidis TaxID=2721623 RepID=A0ABX1GUD2_9FLAO|nr:hypothetical protein [Croceivirga thetidis]NKI32535.1 hypothetical protein [Croceivirga thetidis]
MKKSLLLIVLAVLASCSGVKKTQQALNTGNYLTAMNRAIDNLSKNKTKKGNQQYVLMLEEAFAKHTERELNNINFLQNDGNHAGYRQIYESYTGLKDLQNRISPLLPLPVYDESRQANFTLRNYDHQIVSAKNELSKYLFESANNTIENAVTKLDFRRAYEDLHYLEEINPGAYDVVELMETSYKNGLDYVKVKLNNNTEQILPSRLEEELLDFNAFGVNNFWTQYHTNPIKDFRYDYEMELDFERINISPEQVQEKQLVKEKLIKDGFEYVLDENGNVAKDSLGNDIKVDKFKKVKCSFYQFTQLKTAQVGAQITFRDLQTKQDINSYPISSQFVFEHVYARHSGDRRALDDDLIGLLDLVAIQFPSNEQMVYDAGEDLKNRLSEIVRRHGFN